MDRKPPSAEKLHFSPPLYNSNLYKDTIQSFKPNLILKVYYITYWIRRIFKERNKYRSKVFNCDAFITMIKNVNIK